MRKLTSLFLLSVVFAAIAFLSADVSIRLSYRNAAFDVCRLVERNYYRSAEPETVSWLEDCFSYARAQETFIDPEKAIGDLNDLLSRLAVSHLALYTPDENKQIWENEGLDTGIRALNLEENFVVKEVLPGSAAEESGVKIGDRILLIDGEPIGNTNQLTWMSGNYQIERGDSEKLVKIVARVLTLDLQPTLTMVQDNIGILRIQSFLPQYFEVDDWLKTAAKLSELDYAVIDLRGNSGGSFPAMMRALSAFHCSPKRIGTLYQTPYGKTELEQDLGDDLSVDSQLAQLSSAQYVHLRTFSGYPCFSGEAVVLIDGDTSSVAEIFADSFFDRTHAEVWGASTAGQVVMAQWFPLMSLGRGDFSLAIPIAGYKNARGVEIEDSGVAPEKILVYELSEALKGTDSWLKSALSEFAQ